VGGRNMTALAAKMTDSIREAKQVSFITAVLMAVALCFHSILEVRLVCCGLIFQPCMLLIEGIMSLGGGGGLHAKGAEQRERLESKG